MSFEIGLVDTRDGSEMEEEGYEAILFLDGKQRVEPPITHQVLSRDTELGTADRLHRGQDYEPPHFGAGRLVPVAESR